MGYSFLDFMKQIGIFIICAQSFTHFSAGKSYEKYVKLLIGIMVLMQFVTPIKALFAPENYEELQEEVERFQKELESAAGEIVWEYEESDETALALEKEIKEKLEAVAAEYGTDVKAVKVYDNPPMVEITVGQEKKEERIEVGRIEIGGQEDTSGEKYKEMRQAFGFVLNTDEAYIMIREE